MVMGKLYSMQRGEAAAHLPVLAVGSNMFATGENANVISLIIARSRVPSNKALLRSFSILTIVSFRLPPAGPGFFC